MKRRYSNLHWVFLIHFTAIIIALTALAANAATSTEKPTIGESVRKWRKLDRPNGARVTSTGVRPSPGVNLAFAAYEADASQILDSFSGTTRSVSSLPDDAPASLPCPETLHATERQICVLTNRERAKKGAGPVSWDASLAKVAMEHADDMFQRGYLSHTNPDGETMKDRLNRHAIRFGYAGENLAEGYTNGNDAITGWMNSSGHRENLLRPQFTRIGAAQIGDKYVQIFTD